MAVILCDYMCIDLLSLQIGELQVMKTNVNYLSKDFKSLQSIDPFECPSLPEM
jgi:hypothetical protein